MILSTREHLWVIVHSLSDCAQPLNTHWVCMNANEWVWTASEHHWVHIHAIEWVWTLIEWMWPPLSFYWVQLTVVWPQERIHFWTALECKWVRLSTFERVWTPASCYWVHLNALVWVLNRPWMLLRAHESLWVSVNRPWTCIECTWMPVSKYFEGLNVHM
jgi:hypothetical protein